MSAHAPIQPSALALTVACNASVQLQNTIPEQPDTEEEAEGKAAHLVAMWAAQGKLFDVGTKFKCEGRDWVVDIDMYNGAKLYARTIGPDCRLEDSVKCSRIHPTQCWGTPDAWKASTPARIRVGDYKYGHRYVEVFENFQLIAYAAGVLERLNLDDTKVEVELILVQPRSYHRDGPVRSWIVPAVELRALVNIARGAAERALLPNPTATTGLHCIDCRARHVCATLKQATNNIIDYSGTAELAPLDPMAMGSELRILDAALQRLTARRTGLAVMVEATLRAGQRVPHYELRPGQSRLKWLTNTTPEQIAMLGDLFNVKTRKPLETITPRQAIDAGIDEKVVLEYADRPAPAMVMKPVDTTAANKVFSKPTARETT